MLSIQSLKRLDFRFIPIILSLMAISLLVISATTYEVGDNQEVEGFFTAYVKNQLQWFGLGWGVYLFFSLLDYRKLKPWAGVFYVAMIVVLCGLFFASPIKNVHRWYRVLGFTFQPSEYAKLIVVMMISWFLERRERRSAEKRTAFISLLLVAIPFFLILRQPDLGTALVLFPIALVLFYLGGIHRKVVRGMSILALGAFFFTSLIFLKILPHEQLRPYFTHFIKDYQYERLNPDTYHQNAAQTAISIGGITGSGWRKSIFTGRKWLPAAHTDSVFPAYAEEFGLVGVVFLLGIFFSLIYCSFQVTAVAKDRFGCLLSAGITVYIAIHILVNLGMMAGFLPITGVPLILVSYGGSSVIATMAALGILQSIYIRRFTF